MTLEPHPHIKGAPAVEFELMPDGAVLPVTVIFTDLELSNVRPGFDEKAWADLIGHIQRWQKLNGQQQVRVRKI